MGRHFSTRIGCGRWIMFVVLYLSVGAFACVGKCRSYGAQYYFSFVCTQGSVRAFGTLATLGYAGVPPFQGSLHAFVCVYPRVPYRALPSFRPGLCRSIALSGLFSDKSKINVSACTCCSECVILISVMFGVYFMGIVSPKEFLYVFSINILYCFDSLPCCRNCRIE